MLGKERKTYKHLNRAVLLPLALFLLFFLTPAPALFAHKVYVFAWVEGETVYTESYFKGKKKVKAGLIKVFDPSGRELLRGKTDEKGMFSFKVPEKTDLRIVLEAGMGHRAAYTLKADESSEIAFRSDPTVENRDSHAPSPASVQVDMEQIRMMVEEALDARLRPIHKTLTRIKQDRGPGITEIIGGIGYIFGLAGLILYFKGRKRPDS